MDDRLTLVQLTTIFAKTNCTAAEIGIDDDPSAPPQAHAVMSAFAQARGFMTTGRPDESRAARVMLKDYMNGRVLYAHPPPGGFLTPQVAATRVDDVTRLRAAPGCEKRRHRLGGGLWRNGCFLARPRSRSIHDGSANKRAARLAELQARAAQF